MPTLRNAGGETNIRATAGPMARCTADLVLVMRSLLQEPMWINDPALARQPWREERYEDKKRLTIGYYTDDTWFSPAPACVRAVNEAAEALRRLGHTVVPYKPIAVSEAVRLFVGILQADGMRHFLDSLENEAINPLYSSLLQAAALPRFIRPLAARLLRLLGERRNALVLASGGAKTVDEYFELIIDLKEYIQRWFDDMRTHRLDLLLVRTMRFSSRERDNEPFSF